MDDVADGDDVLPHAEMRRRVLDTVQVWPVSPASVTTYSQNFSKMARLLPLIGNKAFQSKYATRWSRRQIAGLLDLG